jgi:hypothetical protein
VRLKVRLAIQARLGLAWFDPELNPLDVAPAARAKEQHGKSTKRQWPSSTSNCKWREAHNGHSSISELSTTVFRASLSCAAMPEVVSRSHGIHFASHASSMHISAFTNISHRARSYLTEEQYKDYS